MTAQIEKSLAESLGKLVCDNRKLKAIETATTFDQEYIGATGYAKAWYWFRRHFLRGFHTFCRSIRAQSLVGYIFQ